VIVAELIAPAGQRSTTTTRAIALHEAGHAVVAHELDLPVLEISIVGSGTVGGWVDMKPDDPLITRDSVERLATVLLAGRAADSTIGRGANSGAASDIEKVNVLLRTAALDLGLYGALTTRPNTDLRDFGGPSSSFWHLIRTETNRALNRATEIVERRRGDILKLVDVLVAERVVTGERLAEILGADAVDPVDADTATNLDTASYPMRRP